MQKVYNVTGTVTSGMLGSLEVESFSCNACAMSKGHAAELVDSRLRSDGYRGAVVAHIEALPGGCGHYAIGHVTRIA